MSKAKPKWVTELNDSLTTIRGRSTWLYVPSNEDPEDFEYEMGDLDGAVEAVAEAANKAAKIIAAYHARKKAARIRARKKANAA